MSMLPFQQTASPESESSEAIETIVSANISQPEVVLSLLVFHPIKVGHMVCIKTLLCNNSCSASIICHVYIETSRH